MQLFNKKPIVTYIAYEPYGIEYLNRFIKHYLKYNSGHDHDLVICFKEFESDDKIFEWEKTININYIKFDDSKQKNDFDIGSYFRIAKKYSDRLILFLDTHTRPNTNNWLKFYVDNYKEKSILGATASYSSLPSLFFSFFFKQHSILEQIRWGIKHLFHVKLFPNPHIRTTGFFIKAGDMLSCKFDTTKFIKKIETNYFEGGRKGLSNQLIKKGFQLLLLNSDGKCFNIPDWKLSETYCLGSQRKLIFIDNRTEEFSKSNTEEKIKRTRLTWGKI